MVKEYQISEFISMLLPSEEVIFKPFNVPYKAKTNSIKWVKTIMIGDSGLGKTETCRFLVEKVVENYSPDKLEAMIVPRELMNEFFTMPYFLPNKPIKAIFFDDAADKNLTPRQKDNWHRLRHVMKERTHGEQHGLILTFIASQDFYSLNIGLRRNYHCLLAKGGPQNAKDERDFKHFFGEDGLNMLQKYTLDWMHGTQEFDFAVFNIMGKVGYFRTPPATRDYFTEFKYLG